MAMLNEEPRWTQGPWKAERCGASEIEIGAETPRGHLSVAWVHLGAKPKEADVAEAMRDARLIAAAPNLFRALWLLRNLAASRQRASSADLDLADAALRRAVDSAPVATPDPDPTTSNEE